MDNPGSLIVACVVVGSIIVLCLVCAWKYWHGEWLRSISGNTFATDEELESPYQKRVGKRVALVAFTSAIAMIVLLGVSIFNESGNTAARVALWPCIVVTLAVIVGGCVWVNVVSWRESKALAKDAVANNPHLAKDFELDKRQAVVLIVIILAEVSIELGISFFARG